MLDADKDLEILNPLAKTKCTDWVPSRMDKRTADTFWEILQGTEIRYGCVSTINQGECLVS